MNFEAWCYRDVARPRLNREQLMEIAEELRDKGYVSEGDMRECLEAVAYRDIKNRVRKEVESRIDSERRKYRELARQIESERKSPNSTDYYREGKTKYKCITPIED